jgi:hypothetical protein
MLLQEGVSNHPSVLFFMLVPNTFQQRDRENAETRLNGRYTTAHGAIGNSYTFKS